MKRVAVFIISFVTIYSAGFVPAYADEYTSASFKSVDPVLSSGSISTSNDYQLTGTVSQIAPGTSDSAGYQGYGGFLYYGAIATTPTVTVTPSSDNGPIAIQSVSSSAPASPSAITTPSVPPVGSVASALTATISIHGRSIPNTQVVITRNGVQIGTATVDELGDWLFTARIAPGVATITTTTTDADGRRSVSAPMTVLAGTGQTAKVVGVLAPPTVGADKEQVKIGNMISFSGYTYPFSLVTLYINSAQTIVATTTSLSNGFWSYDFPSNQLEQGSHTVQTQVKTPDGIISALSKKVTFKVGDKDIIANAKPAELPAAQSTTTPGAPLTKVSTFDLTAILLIIAIVLLFVINKYYLGKQKNTN
jgi:hypothetical protein